MHFYYKSAKKNNYSFTDRLQEADLPCGGFLNSPTDSHGWTRVYHADGYFILPQIARMNTDFFYENIKNSRWGFASLMACCVTTNESFREQALWRTHLP